MKQHEYDDDYTHWPTVVITGGIVAGVFAILFWLGSM